MNINFVLEHGVDNTGWIIVFAIAVGVGIIIFLMGFINNSMDELLLGFLLAVGFMLTIAGAIGLIESLQHMNDTHYNESAAETSLHSEILKTYGLNLKSSEIKSLISPDEKPNVFDDHLKIKTNHEVVYFGKLTTANPKNQIIKIELARVNKVYELVYGNDTAKEIPRLKK
jgi:hypothetical protein